MLGDVRLSRILVAGYFVLRKSAVACIQANPDHSNVSTMIRPAGV